MHADAASRTGDGDCPVYFSSIFLNLSSSVRYVYTFATNKQQATSDANRTFSQDRDQDFCFKTKMVIEAPRDQDFCVNNTCITATNSQERQQCDNSYPRSVADTTRRTGDCHSWLRLRRR